ncbi:hypothetical protein ACC697_38165, partial [Rhizobium ruizarguesonis]
GLALHELATNSVKYGALSLPQGRFRFEWRDVSEEDKPDALLRFTWEELGGPPVTEQPSRSGFGTTVIKAHARRGRDSARHPASARSLCR